ncbi:uridine kinase [Bacteriovoracaceae bacterium]|nr:uridine kinase [Bacteriovoracaceae bacterium]
MYLIGIAGGSGSGKTTFAQKIIQRSNENNIHIIHQDSYYLNEIPTNLSPCGTKLNFDHPEAFDWELLLNHLYSLREGHSIECPNYDFKSSKRLNSTTEIVSGDVILFEGIFTLYNSMIREMLDLKIFLNVEADIRFARRLSRDLNDRNRSLDSVVNQYYATVRPMYKEFLEPQQQYSDLIVGEETDMAADVIAAKIRNFIQEKSEPIRKEENIEPSPFGI